jgi:hypothetical protein
MNNARLNQFSNVFQDVNTDRIEQRCFFLFAGTDIAQGSAFSLEAHLFKPDDPKEIT